MMQEIKYVKRFYSAGWELAIAIDCAEHEFSDLPIRLLQQSSHLSPHRQWSTPIESMIRQEKAHGFQDKKHDSI